MRLLTVVVIFALSHTALMNMAEDSTHPVDKEAAKSTNSIGSEMHILGVTLVDPTEELIKKTWAERRLSRPHHHPGADPDFLPGRNGSLSRMLLLDR